MCTRLWLLRGYSVAKPEPEPHDLTHFSPPTP